MEQVVEILRRVLPVARGVAKALGIAALAGVAGAVVGGIGLILLGLDGPLVIIAILLTIIALVPAFLAWRFRGGMLDLIGLPQKLSSLGDVPSELADDLDGLSPNLISAGKLGRAILGLRSDLLSLARAGVGAVADTLMVVNPARLAVTAGAVSAIPIVVVVGLVLLVLGLVL